MTEDDYITQAEAARIFDVHLNTVGNWIKSGRLVAAPPIPGAQKRLRRSEVIAAARGSLEIEHAAVLAALAETNRQRDALMVRRGEIMEKLGRLR